MIRNNYQLALGIFAQASNGTTYAKLPDEFAALKFALSSSIMPKEYDCTNLQMGDITIETIEKNSIFALTKARKYDSGAMTPPTLTFNTMTPADVANLVSSLDALTASDADDQYKVLVAVGIYAGTNTGVRTYNVFNAFAGILTTDGGRTAEAKAPFTGTLGFQACHLPILGTSNCAATLTWTESTGVISFAANSGSGSGS